MKINSYRSRAVLTLIAACLFIGADAPNPAVAADSHWRRTGGDPSRLIIRRIPNLGNHVIVNLSVDGGAVESIGFGHTYEGVLAPGRHVLSVVATPSAKWGIPSQITLDARSGQTYTFTVMGDHSGGLILKGG